ncbi:MAG: hypothetical protein M1814_000640 [Vezdaea aestivalis]|nr:MAG: hypothetical protein M1814_000640 [Vezdaea aestivalis]
MAEKDEYLIPLQDQRVFGAGLKRKRVQFVPSANKDSSLPSQAAVGPERIRSRYLDIVFGPVEGKGSDTKDPTSYEVQTETANSFDTPDIICEVCTLPLRAGDESHNLSTAHQACLSHSHPPSHLDRRRKGLKYLETYGWDPDGRMGLGANGAGILDPIKAEPKNNNAGIGMKLNLLPKADKKVRKLNPKQLKAEADKNKPKDDRLRRELYADPSVASYLDKLDRSKLRGGN